MPMPMIFVVAIMALTGVSTVDFSKNYSNMTLTFFPFSV